MFGLIREPKSIDEALDIYLRALAAEGNKMVRESENYPEQSLAYIDYNEGAYLVAYTMLESARGFGRLMDSQLGTVYLKEAHARILGEVGNYMDEMMERRNRSDRLVKRSYDEAKKIMDDRRRRREEKENQRKEDGRKQ